MNSSLSSATVTAAPVLSFPQRRSSDFLSTVELASLLRANLGLNSRKVTVAKRSSLTYVDVTVRDPSVDLRAVTAFCASLDTWSMDQTDYCTGQSISVKTTREVDVEHAAPHLSEIRAKVAALFADGLNVGLELSNGKLIWLRDGEIYVTSSSGVERGCYIRVSDLRAGSDWAFEALALQMARVG